MNMPTNGAQEIHQAKLATTQPHQVIHGQSGLNLLADHRLHEIDPREPPFSNSDAGEVKTDRRQPPYLHAPPTTATTS